MNQLKILILMSYYQRPILVRKALNSLLVANNLHQNWVLAFGDDGSKIPGRPIVEDVLTAHIGQVTFVQSNMTFEDKIKQGLILGQLANEAMQNSDADIAFILCDDDVIVPDYLKNLSDFFINNPQVLYCHSKLFIYNPINDSDKTPDSKYNKWAEQHVNPVNRLDASQVAWRLDCCKKYGAWFQSSTKAVEGKPWVMDTDKSFFENLYAKCGESCPTGFFGQCKGIHDYQLLWHKNSFQDSLLEYNKMCNELGGTKF